jgi:hypothetical protein
MSQDSGGNMVLGVAVAVLGFVLYTRYAQAKTQAVQTNGQVQQTGPSKGLLNTIVGANLAASLVSSFKGTLGGTTAGGQNSFTLPEAFTSTAWNPDEISSDIASDSYAALGAQGMDTSNVWGFYE